MKSNVEIIDKAKSIKSKFVSLVCDVKHEPKGVLHSEILFILACIEEPFRGRLLESGRARGQSTLLLRRVLPETEIVSVEISKESEDALIAERRLKRMDNVKLLYGDANKILPEIIKKGDAVLIDGPKMFVAIRLGLRLLSSKKPCYVFIHDMSVGTYERKFLNTFFPEARFSDHRSFAEVVYDIDLASNAVLPRELSMGGFSGEYGYGASLVCVPFENKKFYKFLYILSFLYDFWGGIGIFSRFKRKFGFIWIF